MRLATAAFAVLQVTSTCAAAAPSIHRGSAGELRLEAPRVARGPVVDGALTDSVWAQAAVLDSFVQRDPREGLPDTLGTQCLVLYDDRHLYVGFRCRDVPGSVRAPIEGRDRMDGDWVGVALDTYHDRRKSYLFVSSPRGVQSDGVDQQGSDTDYTPDFLFVSKGRILADGYEVEMAIPFTSLRFPARDTLAFGIEATRLVEREHAMLFWAPITRDRPGFAEQFGVMDGLTGIHPGRNLSLIPTVTGTRSAAREGGPLAWESKTRAGATLTCGVTSGLTANVAVTPDFSQVEADAGVLDVNQRFAIYFDEKRPFFLEGTEIFKTPIQAVYTRRIVDPLYGVKLTGKLAGTSLGVIQAEDRASRSIETLPDRVNPYAGRNAPFTVARFKQDVLSSSSFGLLVGERRQGESYDRDLGLDGTLNLLDRWTLSLQRLQSWSRDRDLSGAIAKLTPEEGAALDPGLLKQTGRIARGDATRAEFTRHSKGLNAGVYALDVSPDFKADMGFIPRTDQLEFGTTGAWHFFPKGASWFDGISPYWVYSRTYDHDGRRLTDENLNLELQSDLRHHTWCGIGGTRTFTDFGGRTFAGQLAGYVFAGSQRFRTVQPDVTLDYGDVVLFDAALPGRSLALDGTVNVRLGDRLSAALSLKGQRLRRREGPRFADLAIPRARLDYQFTRELALRWIAELRAESRYDSLGVSAERTRRLTLDLLWSYVVNPGTVFYLGWGAALEGPSAPALKLEEGRAFLKLSYLWQM